jgi:hypothetical protein
VPKGGRRREPAGVALASLPLLSFVLQLVFSQSAGTLGVLFRHPTVMYLDWVFVPFNFLIASIIDWNRGAMLYLITALSVALSILTHAYWQYDRLDPGHMITMTGVVLPAGWVHLAFSTLQMILLAAFVVCRRASAPGIKPATALAVGYFVLVAICSYILHRRFIASDVIVSVSGTLAVLFYPRLGRSFLSADRTGQ